MAGRAEDSVAQTLSRYKLALPNAGATRRDVCTRTTQLVILETLIVLFICSALLGAGAVHRRVTSTSGHHGMTRYQRGRASSIQAFTQNPTP